MCDNSTPSPYVLIPSPLLCVVCAVLCTYPAHCGVPDVMQACVRGYVAVKASRGTKGFVEHHFSKYGNLWLAFGYGTRLRMFTCKLATSQC